MKKSLTVKCFCCDREYRCFTGDQGVSCATYKFGKIMQGEYGSSYDTHGFDVLSPALLKVPDNSNFCDSCVKVFIQLKMVLDKGSFLHYNEFYDD